MAYFKCKAPKIPTGSQSFTETTTWTIPSRVRKISIALVGAGGAGGSSGWYRGDKACAAGAGGGAGGYITRVADIPVSGGMQVSVSVGSGNTTLTVNGTTYTANAGGSGGDYYWSGGYLHGGNGGSGGSGGGGGARTIGNASPYAGQSNGGSNGGNGAGGNGGSAGSGGSGNSQDCYINGVLFSSGGRGGSAASTYVNTDSCNDGGANTGNGGGGANGGYSGTRTWGASGGTGFALVTY